MAHLSDDCLISLKVANEKDRRCILENVKKFWERSPSSPREDKSATNRVTEWLSENKKYVGVSHSHDT